MGCVSRAGDFGFAAETGDDDDIGLDEGPGDDDPDGPVPPPPDEGPLPMPQMCPSEGELDGEFITVDGTTQFGDNLYEPTCAPAFGPDAHYVWTPPYDGQWRIDTQGSAIDTVLSLHEGECTAQALACSDDDFDLTSRIEAFLPGGRPVTIVVDGFESETGEYVLNIRPIDGPPPPTGCETIDLGVVTSVLTSWDASDDTQAAPADFCPFPEPPQAVFSFVAGETGRYRLSSGGEQGELAVLDLRDEECRADSCEFEQLELDLEAGESVRVGALLPGASSGVGVLSIELVDDQPPPPPPGTCPQYDLPFGLPVKATSPAGGGQAIGLGSCSPQAPASVASFGWVAPGYGDIAFSASVAGTLTGITVQEANCSGPELGCVVPTGVNGGQASVTVPVKKGRTYVVSVGTSEPPGTEVSVEVVAAP